MYTHAVITDFVNWASAVHCEYVNLMQHNDRVQKSQSQGQKIMCRVILKLQGETAVFIVSAIGAVHLAYNSVSIY